MNYFKLKRIIINFILFYIDEKEFLKLTNPDNIQIESNYQGPRN